MGSHYSIIEIDEKRDELPVFVFSYGVIRVDLQDLPKTKII